MPAYDFLVRDSRTDEVIPNAQISLYRLTNFTNQLEGGVTDASGRLSIDTGMGIALAYSILKEGYVRIRSIDLHPTNDVRMDSTEVKYTVTFFARGGGDVSPKGPLTVAVDSRVEATATPDSGYVFRAWVIDNEDYDYRNPFTFPIVRDGLSIIAEFETEAVAEAKKPREAGEVVTEVVVTTTVSSGIPWPFTWIGDVINWFGQAWENTTKSTIEALKREREEYQKATQAIEKYRTEHGDMTLREATKSAGLGGWLWGGLSESMGELVKNSMNEALAEVVRLAPEATGHSPEAKKQMAAVLEPYANSIVDAVLAEVNPAKYAHSPITPEEAKNSLNLIMGGIVSVEIGLFVAHAFLEGATLGQVEALSQIENMVISKLGLNQVASAAITIPLNELVLKRAQQYYAAQYTPELPGAASLINMRMKEIIGQTEFEANYKLHGFSNYWAGKEWDAHFIPPSLADILTAWRRGILVRYPKSDPATGTIVWVGPKKLDETDVRYLLESIDLDPRYIDIFETRKYVDPPLSITRFMFEEGVIKADTVHNLVELQGYRPEHVEYITKYITEFQERLWRRRYLVTLQGGYQKGVYTGVELETAVLDAGYTPDVAHWIIANADARKKIEGSAVAVEEKAKLISVGDLKKAYVRNMIDADKLRIDLGVRGYQTMDIDLLVKLLDEEKVVTSAGGEKVALSVPEWINAWRYRRATEDRVRMELQLRGLSLEEVEILLSTKKAQWGVEDVEVG